MKIRMRMYQRLKGGGETMYRRTRSWVKHLDFMFLDLLCMHLAFLAAWFIRHGMRNPYGDEVYLNLLLFSALTNLLASIVLSTYKSVLKRGYWREAVMTGKQVLAVVLVAQSYLFTVKESAGVSRLVVYLMAVCYAVFSYSTRLLWKRFLKKKLKGGGKRSLLVVTVPEQAREVVENVRKYNYEMFRLKGLVLAGGDERINAGEEPGIKENYEETDRGEIIPEEEKEACEKESGIDGKQRENCAGETSPEEGMEACGGKRIKEQEIGGVPVVASVKDVASYVCREWVDEVLVVLPETEGYTKELLQKFMEMGIVVHMSMPEAFNPYGQKQFMENICRYPVVTTGVRYATDFQVFLKRGMDIVVGTLGSLLTLLLVPILGPLIYIHSPGPIFFTQVRVGKNGKRFKMYKFRSMYMDAEERRAELMRQNSVKDGMMFKLDNDPRIIGSKVLPDGTVKKGFGNFIRDWSLDEFPQFFNVLKGDMSIVGTRPPTVDEWEKYDLHHRRRLSIKPGITGLWQTSGRSNITDFEEVVRMDTEYIMDWDIGKDIRIFLKTIGVVARREGAK